MSATLLSQREKATLTFCKIQ